MYGCVIEDGTIRIAVGKGVLLTCSVNLVQYSSEGLLLTRVHNTGMLKKKREVILCHVS